MRKIAVLILLSILAFPFAHAQTSRDTISIIRNSYWYRGDPLSANQLLDKMQNNPDAYAEMSIAKSNYDVAMVCSYIGGFCIGYPIGQAIGGGKPVWALAGIGVGVVIIAIPLSISFNKHARNAVRIYNSNLTRFGLNKLNVKIEFSGSGIGLCCRF
jgi:hypothetical protein